MQFLESYHSIRSWKGLNKYELKISQCSQHDCGPSRFITNRFLWHIALTETWLDSDFRDSELQLNGYNIFRWENVTQQKKEQTNKIVSRFWLICYQKRFELWDLAS